MRTDLSHLPLRKQRELERVRQILFEQFEAATKGAKSAHKRGALILKVILFGSYARGNWVEDRASGYLSDYDLLIVVNDEQFTDHEYWRGAEDQLLQEEAILKRLKTPVGLIVHSLGDVNDQLAKGRYFFADIAREGIALYEMPGHRFIQPKPLSAEEARAEAQGFFDEWLPGAERRLKVFTMERAEGLADPKWRKDAAFTLHQAAERLYHCLLLVHTLYSPPSHNLTFLRNQTEGLDPRLLKAWPRDTKLARQRFQLLKRAYVEARYSPHYKITTEELDWLAERIAHLRDLVEQSCRERLSSHISEG